jgi:phage gp36-like protein
MTIAAQSDLIEHLGNNGAIALAQITDPAGAVIDSALVTASLERADDEIYAWISAVVAVPMSSPYPPLLVKIACVICLYWLWAGDERPDRIKDDYKWATTMLRDIAAGKVSLGLAGNGSGPAETSGNSATFESSTSVFSRAAGDY